MNFIDKKLDFSKHIINGLTSELKGYYLYKKYAEDKNSVLFVTSNLYEANKEKYFLCAITLYKHRKY